MKAKCFSFSLNIHITINIYILKLNYELIWICRSIDLSIINVDLFFQYQAL